MNLKVSSGDWSYPIFIGRNMEFSLMELREKLKQEERKAIAIVDQGLSESNPQFCDKFLASMPVLLIPSGEPSKSVSKLHDIWNFLAVQKLDRSGVIFAIGGGVTGDLAGFAAASFLRGVEFYQIPTTLLAMVDSSVGGKTGINLDMGKNLVGAFHQPSSVFVDMDALNTLSKREFSAGIAEVIKYGLLGKRDLFDRLANRDNPINSSSEDLPQIIYECCAEKARIVGCDEKERSSGKVSRALLNLGHTFAHAIEACSGYGYYLHGEAVSIGLVCALRLSQKMGFCKSFDESNLIDLLSSYDLPIELQNGIAVTKLLESMTGDKKVLAGKIRFVLMHEIGDAFLESEIPSEVVADIWRSVGAT